MRLLTLRLLTIAFLALFTVRAAQAQEPRLPPTSSTAKIVAIPELPRSEIRSEFTPSATEQQLLDLANSQRKKAGATPLTCSPLLIQAARRHSANMARQGRLDHSLDGKGPAERLNEVGYGWCNCAENIAWGQHNPSEAIDCWMHSPGHRANLLSTNCTEIGVAVATGADGQRYWTMVLARSR